MILPTHSNMRYTFAVRTAEALNLTFNVGAPCTIVRGAGVWPVAMIDQYMDVLGTVSNNTRYHVTGVPGIATLEVEETVVAEGPVACTYESFYRDPDGLERWPIALVRSGGIGSITGTPTPYMMVPFEATINAHGADAVPGTDEYDWYLSQRTDVAASQLINIQPHPVVGGNTYSGTVYIAGTSLSGDELGYDPGDASTWTPDKVPGMFKYAHLYVRRRSDGAIQWIDLLRAMTANY